MIFLGLPTLTVAFVHDVCQFDIAETEANPVSHFILISAVFGSDGWSTVPAESLLEGYNLISFVFRYQWDGVKWGVAGATTVELRTMTEASLIYHRDTCSKSEDQNYRFRPTEIFSTLSSLVD